MSVTTKTEDNSAMMNKRMSNALVAIGLVFTAPVANAAELSNFSTSLGIAVDENGNSISPDIDQDFARFQDSASLNGGPDLDLLVDLQFPEENDSNFGNANDRQGAGTVGLAGAGVAFSGLDRSITDADAPSERVGPDTRYEDFILNYRFVESGTDTVVQLDKLSLGFRDLDLNQSAIGREVLTLPNVSSVVVETGGSVDANQVPDAKSGVSPSGSAVQLIPQSNNNDVRVNLFDVGSFDVRFFNRTGGTNPVSGGFNVVGGSAIDVGHNPSITQVPAPMTSFLLLIGLISVAFGRAAIPANRTQASP
jgi:hypothetical protein